MSRFFASGDSSDEASDEEQQETPKTSAEALPTTTRYAMESSDEEEEQQRVVRSEKDKRWETLKSIITNLKNAQKIKDWTKILDQFERLTKELEKAKKVTRKEGIPKFYFQAILDLDEYLKETSKNKEEIKKMKVLSQKAMASMKSKLLRHTKEFEKELEAYAKDPLKDSGGSDDEKVPEKEKKRPGRQEI